MRRILHQIALLTWPCSKTIRKSIATVLTVISQHSRTEVAKQFVNSKHKPLDLREKKARRRHGLLCG